MQYGRIFFAEKIFWKSCNFFLYFTYEYNVENRKAGIDDENKGVYILLKTHNYKYSL